MTATARLRAQRPPDPPIADRGTHRSARGGGRERRGWFARPRLIGEDGRLQVGLLPLGGMAPRSSEDAAGTDLDAPTGVLNTTGPPGRHDAAAVRRPPTRDHLAGRQGLSYEGIAHRVTTSIRSVEGHLFRACQCT